MKKIKKIKMIPYYKMKLKLDNKKFMNINYISILYYKIIITIKIK